MRKKIVAAIVVILLIFSGILVFVHFYKEKNDDRITVAVVDKMLYYVMNQEPKGWTSSDDEWYDMYVDYINELNIYAQNDGSKYITWEDMDDINKYFDGQEYIERTNKYPSAEEFIVMFKNLLQKMPAGKNITETQMVIVGMPENMDTSKEWTLFSNKGEYRFTGLIVKPFIDKTVDVLRCNNEIIAITKQSDSALLKNVWVENCSDKKTETNTYGIARTFKAKDTYQSVENVMADIYLENGVVTTISIKEDEIAGTVLSVSDTFVEIQGYGKIPVDENFAIYDISTNVTIKHINDVVVGYNLQKFIVAEGKICGAVIMKTIEPRNIRVLIKTTGFESIFHDSVVLEADSDCTIENEKGSWNLAAGQKLTLGRDSDYLKGGRIKIKSNTDGEIKVDSIKRGNGTPVYAGALEVAVYGDGLVIVNDVNIEDYLIKVVPSEMPVKYGVEALKVQAVCARSYAYRQLSNDFYSEYGGQVDDSTQYQVYNNGTTNDDVKKAVKETQGKVLTYDGDIIQTYYYSTSCGATTDLSTWGSDAKKYPYYVSTFVNGNQKNLNLTDENVFKKFITESDDSDYDRKCLLYRWEWDLTCENLSRNFNEKLIERYKANPDKVLTKQSDGTYASKWIETVGTITSIDTEGRRPGGALESIVVNGTKASVRIIGEINIRQLINDVTVPLHANGEDTTMSMLPSAFCIFEPVNSNGKITGYKIIGGGYGHGIGMSQNAVYPMTQNGMSYEDILKFFYKGSSITSHYGE